MQQQHELPSWFKERAEARLNTLYPEYQVASPWGVSVGW
jgi:hypothetical protein